MKTDENNSFLEQTRDLKHQITVLKQKIKDTEHQESVTTQLDEHEVSHISPRVLPLKSIETILETKLVNVEERLKQSITYELEKSKRTIDNKLDNIMKDDKSFADSVKGSVSVKENVPRASEVNDFKSILVESKKRSIT